MPAKPAAVLWDFDGTMVDTEPLWGATEQAMLLPYGVVWGEEEMAARHGESAVVTAQHMADAVGQPDQADRWFAELHDRMADHIRSHELPWLPGARELMDAMAADGVRCAVVTASNGQIIGAARERMPEHVEFVITADDVTNTKPHPEGYLLAMRRLGVGPDEVIVLEDSPPGTAAGLASGAFVYAVPSMATLVDQPGLHRATVGLDQITWPELVALWRAHRGSR